MIARVHGRNVCEKCLGRADVAGSFFAANVLLAGLEGEAQSRLSTGIFRNTHDASRHMPLESVPGCKKSSMRTAVPERDSKSLSAADRNIGAELTWRTQKCQAQQIRRDGHQCASFVGGFYESRVVMNFTPGIRVLHQCAEYLVIKLEE